ncbi:MAG: hypothetical protein ACTS4T_01105 [Candidatus Hodgkinia cicadicola]
MAAQTSEPPPLLFSLSLPLPSRESDKPATSLPSRSHVLRSLRDRSPPPFERAKLISNGAQPPFWSIRTMFQPKSKHQNGLLREPYLRVLKHFPSFERPNFRTKTPRRA